MDPLAPAADPKVIEHTARLKIDGLRLDQYLRSLFGEHSRSAVQRLIESGGVAVNGRPAKASYKVRHGDRLLVRQPEAERAGPAAEDIPLEVLHEDEHLAVINKPAD